MVQKHKRILTALITAVVMVCLLTTTAFAAEAPDVIYDEVPVCYIHGDTNNDGTTSKADALYILYSYLLGEEYPITHAASADLNGDSKVNTKDAIYMLYATLLGDEAHPLNGNVHEYYIPFWSWGYTAADPENPESVPVLKATLNIQCSCGKVVAQIDGSITKTAEVAPTCLNFGNITYQAVASYTHIVTVDGEGNPITTKEVTYSSADTGEGYTEELAPLGHIIGEPTCESGVVCSQEGCDTDLTDEVVTPYALPALGHAWELTATDAATCQTPAQEHYVCATCTAEDIKSVGEPIDHTYKYKEDVQVEGSSCQWVKVFACTTEGCDVSKNGDTYYIHSYTAVLTEEPNCTSTGTKTYTCAQCSYSYTESVPANGVHVWPETGVQEGNVITYTCKHCPESKTVVLPKEDGSVTKGDLKDNELQVDEAAFALNSDALPNVDDEAKIKVSVTEITAGNLSNLDPALQAQIGSNTVYDFSMTVDEAPTSEFGGTVTISLPYTLQEGDDVDAIDVWFINDSGNVTVVQGIYSNGFVTFSTDHFSYYTVTRLTPAQRCAVYGHQNTDTHKDPTCTEDGYDMTLCQRCGHISKKEPIAMLGHVYGEPVYTTQVSCTTDGIYTKTCTNTNCTHTVTGTTPSLGHIMVVDEANTRAATCTEAGVTAYTCDRENCSHSTKMDIAPLGHQWNEDTAEVHYVSCTEAGYTEYSCDRCQMKLQADKQDPLGHAYVAEGWTWANNYKSATLKIVCKNDHAHDQIVKGVITSEVSAASCTSTGEAIHTATVVFNGKTYTSDPQIETLAKNAHKPKDEWNKNDKTHSRFCTVCQQTYDIADHAWGNCKVTTPATCNKPGSQEHTCSVCNHGKHETIPATGVHNLKDGVCVDCGFTENTCNHVKMFNVPMDLSGLNVCADAEIILSVCECGMRGYINSYEGCNFGKAVSTPKTLADGTKIEVARTVCADCGMVKETDDFIRINSDTCTGEYINYFCLTINGNTLLELEDLYNTTLHPTVPSEDIDLSQYGLCNDSVLSVSTCPCGEVTWSNYQGCNFMPGDTEDVFVCLDCGVSRTTSGSSQWVGCELHDFNTFVLSMNGTEILTYYDQYIMTQHAYKATKIVMNGTTCEDGVEVLYECAGCGDSYEGYHVGHYFVNEVVTDLSSYGSCDTKHAAMSCACGQQNIEYVDCAPDADHYHAWTTVSDTEAALVRTCSNCGFTCTTTKVNGPKDESCNYPVTTTETYSDGNGHSYTVNNVQILSSHDIVPQFELKGQSCTDGVTISLVCRDCGLVDLSETLTEHYPATNKFYDLSTVSDSTTKFHVSTCACGAYSSLNWEPLTCNFQQVDGGENVAIYQCADCGLYYKESYSKLSAIDACHNRILASYDFYKTEGTTLLNASFTTTSEEHRLVCTLTLNDPALGCDGGWTGVSTCLDCGYGHEISDAGNNGHCQYPIAWDYKPNQLCGDLNLITYSCPCGADHHTDTHWENGACDFQHTDSKFKEDPATGGWTNTNIYTCVQCGATMEEKQVTVPKNDGTCMTTVTDSLTYKTKTGKNAGSYINEYEAPVHQNLTTAFNLLNPDLGCDGGYTATHTCANCGATFTEDAVMYGCSTHTLRNDVILQHEDICGDITMSYHGCACGKTTEVYINTNCQWDYGNSYWDETLQQNVVPCMNCGLVECSQDIYTQHPTGCFATLTFNRKYILNDQELSFNSNYVASHTVSYHNNTHSFNLFGSSCEDGFEITPTCQDCGFVGGTWTNYEHNTYPVQVYDLREYGMCGMRITYDVCACGQNEGVFWNTSGCDLNWVDGPNGEPGYDYCAKCDTRIYSDRSGTVDTSTCTFIGTRDYRIVRNGVDLQVISLPTQETQHTMETYEAELMDPNGSCNDGVRIKERCLYCDYEDDYTVDYHPSIIDFELDLSSGCGGEIRIGHCPCREDSFFHQGYDCSHMTNLWRQETDANGVSHDYHTHSCSDCGLEILTDNYQIKEPGTCTLVCYEDITITYQGQTYNVLNFRNQPEHTMEYNSGSLITPGTTCEDGINVDWVCTECGDSGTINDYKGHALLKKSSIDLDSYTLCENTALNHYECVCGAYQSYDFAPETKCDPDFQPIDHWIAGVVEEASQWTVEGLIEIDSSSYLIRCAVNNDLTSGQSQSCPLTIRMSEYWLVNNCEAEEYQTWQIGYDEKTGTYDDEITIKTGYSYDLHNYQWIDYGIVQTNADGSSVDKHGNVCADCGSVDMNYQTFDSTGLNIRHVWERINELNNGKRKSIISTTVFGVYHNNHAYAISEQHDYTEADNSTWWEKYTFSNYDFSSPPCMRDYVFTDSKGTYDAGRGDACQYPCEDRILKNATCSQPGEKVHCHICIGCGYTQYWEVTPIEPMHSWSQDGATGIYTCSVCGLESNHGASGNIVMEELAKDDPNIYKIGYYVKDDLNFYPAISVVMKNPDGSDAEPVIFSNDTYDFQFTYLTIPNDGVCALTFNKTTVQTAAMDAMDAAGYTGEYAIRITFVPIEFADELDYSITFDSQNYAK